MKFLVTYSTDFDTITKVVEKDCIVDALGVVVPDNKQELLRVKNIVVVTMAEDSDE